MIRLLVKKQMAEMFRGYYFNQKKNQKRSRGGVIALFLMFILLMAGVLGGLFSYLAYNLVPMAQAGNGWFYYFILGGLAVFMGVFGSVFNTYSALYLGKDNAQLLCLPIPVGAILASRVLSVYLMGLLYSAVAAIPAVIVYLVCAGFSLRALIGGILWVLLISVIVLILSCILGYAVAKASLKLKNRSFTKVGISLLSLAAYYFFYFRTSEVINTVVVNAAVYGESVRGKAYPLYLFGRAGEGDPFALAVMCGTAAAAALVVWFVLKKSFLQITTATSTAAKVTYREQRAEMKSPDAALLRKETGRFTASSGYMLNCGLGLVILAVGGIALLIKGRDLSAILGKSIGFGRDLVAVGTCAAICLLVSMVDITAPSVSLEGKTIWISKSLPVSAWQVLKAKLSLHLMLSIPAVLFAGICAVIGLGFTGPEAVLVILVPSAFALLTGAFGLMLGTIRANLVWTNEMYPIKQSLAVFLTMAVGWAIAAALLLLYLVLMTRVDELPYLAAALAVMLVLSLLIIRWLMTRGAARFEQL